MNNVHHYIFKIFHRKLLPLNGKTMVRIELNENFNEQITEILLADVPCLIHKFIEI